MSVDSSTNCPGCHHPRCMHCPLEKAKISINRESFHIKGSTTALGPTAKASSDDVPEPAQDQIITPEIQVTDGFKNSHVDVNNLGLRDHYETSTSTNTDAVFSSKEREKSRTEAEPQSITAQTTFACPYYKHDPSKYTQLVYRTCARPNIPIDRPRELKYHLQSVHGPLYCDHCSMVFNDKKGSALLDHCKSCIGPVRYTKKGISSTQWKIITEIHREKREAKDKFLKKRNEARWHETHGVLLPDAIQPSDPYPVQTEPQVMPCESLMALFQQITRHKVHKGILPYDENRDRINLDTLSEAYYALLNTVPTQDSSCPLEEQSKSQLGWVEEIPSTKSSWLSAQDSSQSPVDPQNDDFYLDDIVMDFSGYDYHHQSSQDRQGFLPVGPYPANNNFYSLPPNFTSSAFQEQAAWTPHLTIDPRPALQKSKSTRYHSPRRHLHSTDTVFDDRQNVAFQSGLSSSGMPELSGSQTALNDTADHQFPATRPELFSSLYGEPIALDSKGHQDVVCELNQLLGLTNASHFDSPDAG